MHIASYVAEYIISYSIIQTTDFFHSPLDDDIHYHQYCTLETQCNHCYKDPI